jgi:hypothetical protein
MFVRDKTIRGYTYLYLVESVREGGRTKQRIIKNLGRKEQVLASGGLDRLAASVGRYAERAMVLAEIEGGVPGRRAGSVRQRASPHHGDRRRQARRRRTLRRNLRAPDQCQDLAAAGGSQIS